jgi:hypothetical protein
MRMALKMLEKWEISQLLLQEGAEQGSCLHPFRLPEQNITDPGVCRVLEAGKSKTVDLVSDEAHFLVHRLLILTSHGGRGIFGPLYKNINPVHEGSTPMT